MSEHRGLVPNQVREIDFYGDVLVVALVKNEAYIALKPVAGFLGLAWSPQYQRLIRDEVLSRHVSQIVMTGADGRQREMTCLQLEYLPGWLFGITPSRVKPDFAHKLIQYREDCFRALWRVYRVDWNILELPITSVVFDKEEIVVRDDTFYLTTQQIVEKIRAQCLRATQAGLPATLTVEQFLFVLKYFEGKCAYCRERPGIVIEHFIPLSLGGGTIVGNCVPSCYLCNGKKRNHHPDVVTKIPREVLDEVHAQLAYFARFFTES